MKKIKFLILLVAAMFYMTTNAQVTRNGNTFKSEISKTKNEGSPTKFTWEDSKGNKYPIYITKSGACYINKKSSKTGKEYKQYLSKEVKEQIQKEVNFKKS